MASTALVGIVLVANMQVAVADPLDLNGVSRDLTATPVPDSFGGKTYLNGTDNLTNSGALGTLTEGGNPGPVPAPYSGTISGALALVHTGGQVLLIGTSNSYTGGTVIQGGTLGATFGTSLGTGNVVVHAGATLTLGNLSGDSTVYTYANGLTLNGAGDSNTGALRSGADLISTGLITLGSDSRINAETRLLELRGGITGAGHNLIAGGFGNIAISGNIATGSGALTKDGTGTLILSGANSYAGATTITAGAINIRHATALGTTAGGTTVASGAALQLEGGITVGAEALTLNGTGTNNDGALRNISGNNNYQGAITLGSASRINSDLGNLTLGNTITGTNAGLTLGGAGNIISNGAIDLGTGSLTKDGAGLLHLLGTTVFSGATTINGGLIGVNNGSAIDDRSAVTINAGSLVIDGSETIGSLAGTGQVQIYQNQLLTVGANDASTTYSGVIKDYSGVGAFTKIGSGTLTLTGANTYTGDTTVSGGNLRVNGSLASAVTVETGATLSGIGIIGGAVTIQSGGKLSAGQSPSTLTVGALTLNAGSTSVFELGTAGTIGGATNDLIVVTNNLTLGGTLNVNAPSAGYYRLFNYGTLTSGSVFSSISGLSQGGGVRVLTNIANQVNLQILSSGQQMQFWDGADAIGNGTVDGGYGTWSATNTNWTGAPGEAGINDQWRGSVAVFTGTSGIVTLVGTQAFDTLQFITDGYVLDAGANGQLQLAGASNVGTINTDAGVTAAIIAPIVNGTATGLTKVGTGTLILSGANTYTGATTIAAGTLWIANAIALGTADNGTTVASGAALAMSGGITVNDEALTLNGTGVANGGALRSISGTNQYLQTITLGSSSLITADANAYLNVMGIVGTNTDLAFGGAGSIAVNSDITTGTSSLTKDGTGFVQLFGNNTYTGVTTINAGLLSVGNGHAIADTGVVVVNASGQFAVASSETIGSLAGAGNVEIRGYEKLTTGGNNTSTTFSGVISETSYSNAELAKTGTGTFTLTGNSTYTGATTVDGGTLSVDGSIARSSMTTVNASGTLSGIGIVGNTTINGGTLAPGNSIGTLNVQGNLSFTSASTYMVEVSPSNADRVNVTGTATLGGATVNANFAAGSYIEKKYTIVNAAGGVNGKFGSQVNTNLPTNFKSGLSYDTRNAYLNLTLDFGPEPTPTPTPGPGPGPTPPAYKSLSGNQASVGNALVGYFNRTGGIPLVFGALDGKGLSQVSGELGTGNQQTTFTAMNMFMGVMTDPFAAGRGEAAPGAMPYADDAMASAGKRAPTDAFAAMHRKAPPRLPVPQAQWNMWAAGFGGSQTTDGQAAAGSNNTTSSIYGMAVGADHWFSPFTVAGISMAGGGTNFSVDGGGSGRSDLFQVGGLIRHTVGATYISAAAAYGWQDITTDRAVTLAGFSQLRANYNANSYAGRIEAGHRVVLPWIGGLGLTPYAAAQVTAFDLPSYAERVVAGRNTFALAYAGKTVTATRSELGFRSDKAFALNDAILTLRGRAAWAHDFNTDRSASATFQTLPGASFVVNGAALARNAALTSVSAELTWMNGWSVAGTFEGEFSEVTRSYAGKGVVRYAW